MKDSLSPLENKWQNVYLFARMLINTDKYGGVGKNNNLLLLIASSLRVIAEENRANNKYKILKLQKHSLRSILNNCFQKAHSRAKRVKKLFDDLYEIIKSSDDMNVFIITCEHVMLPINQAIQNIPNDDREFTLSIAKSFLEVKGIYCY